MAKTQKKQQQRTTREVPTTHLFVHLNEQGELVWGYEGLEISDPKYIRVPPNCVLLDIREYNRLNSLDKTDDA